MNIKKTCLIALCLLMHTTQPFLEGLVEGLVKTSFILGGSLVLGALGIKKMASPFYTKFKALKLRDRCLAAKENNTNAFGYYKEKFESYPKSDAFYKTLILCMDQRKKETLYNFNECSELADSIANIVEPNIKK